MRRAEVIAAISAHPEDIARRFGVRSLSLFGSVARDDAGQDSVVDLLVEFEGPTTFDGHMGLLLFLEGLLGRRVDVVTARVSSLVFARSSCVGHGGRRGSNRHHYGL